MATKKTLAVKFDKADKSHFSIPVGHTRTGACTNRLRGGRCTHGKRK